MSFGPAPSRMPFAQFRADLVKYSWSVAALRSLRRTRVLGLSDEFRRLNEMPAFRQHLAIDGSSDPLFLLAHRHYLAVGLTLRQRMDAALTHYAHEGTLGPDYFAQVYQRGGLVLWRADIAGVAYDIRLLPGNDVLYEGGLSLVFHVDGGRVCVMSFSVVPRRIVLPGGEGDVIFVSRKQMTQNHTYQRAFNAAFDRTTPALLCFSALSGWALPQGFTQAVGIAAEQHLSYAPEYAAQFVSSYSDFWLSLSGEKASPLGYLIDLPSRLTPIDELDSRRRKRALARRGHMEAVQKSAEGVMSFTKGVSAR